MKISITEALQIAKKELGGTVTEINLDRERGLELLYHIF